MASDEPELPEGWALEFCQKIGDGAHYLDPRHVQTLLRSLLSAHGLHIVTAEERQRMMTDALDAVKTRAERAVLEAMSEIPDPLLRGRKAYAASKLNAALRAELARREKTHRLRTRQEQGAVMSDRRLSIHVKGHTRNYSFDFYQDPKHIPEWSSQGLDVREVLNTCPEWVAEWRIVRIWFFFQDVLQFKNPWSKS